MSILPTYHFSHDAFRPKYGFLDIAAKRRLERRAAFFDSQGLGA
jgi:hypothetical protein